MLCCLLVAAGFVLGVDQEQLAGTLSVQVQYLIILIPIRLQVQLL